MLDKMRQSRAEHPRCAAMDGMPSRLENVRIFHNVTSCQRQSFIAVLGMASPALRFIPSRTAIEHYMNVRALSRRLNHKIIDTLPENALLEAGKLLGIAKGKTFILESEDQMSVLADACLYDWVQDGKTPIERYAEKHAPPPETEEYELLQAFLRATYRVVLVESRIEGAGVGCKDIFTGESLFIMDFGLSQSPLNIAYGTRTISVGPFWMTGGAGLPTVRDGVEAVIARLTEEGLLQDGAFTDPHRAAVIIIRTLLAEGASEHIEYRVASQSQFRHSRRLNTRQNAPVVIPGRNSSCTCGSGKRYKRCCGRH